jgi:hypothetical protein
MALNVDEPRFTNEDTFKLGVRPRGNGPHSLRVLAAGAIHDSLSKTIQGMKDEDRPRWSVADDAGKFLEQIVLDAVSEPTFPNILERCSSGEAPHIYIKVEDEPRHGMVLGVVARRDEEGAVVQDEASERGELVGWPGAEWSVKFHTFDVGPAVNKLVTEAKKKP